MTMTVKSLLTAAIVMSVSSFSFGADQVDNPTYKSWAKFKPGTSVTMKTESEAAGTKSEMTSTQTLVEINADKAVVETKMSMNAGGQAMDMPPSKMDIPAKTDKVPEQPADANAPKPEVKESAEDVDVPGAKKVKAKVTESKVSMAGANTNSKVWTSDEIPGGMIKMESTTDGQMKSTTKMTVTNCVIK